MLKYFFAIQAMLEQKNAAMKSAPWVDQAQKTNLTLEL